MIVALDVLVGIEVAAAARVDRASAGLLGPYLVWCLFVTALNAEVGPSADAGRTIEASGRSQLHPGPP